MIKIPEEEKAKQNERLEAEAEAEVNVLKRDISLRIAETTNSFKFLYGSIYGGDGNVGQYWPQFLKDFVALYDATFEQLKEADDEPVKTLDDLGIPETVEEENEDGDKVERSLSTSERIQRADELTVEELEQFFADPMILKTQETENGEKQLARDRDGNPLPDLVASAQRAMDIYREYKDWLRESGMLDLKRYTMTQRTFGGPEQ